MERFGIGLSTADEQSNIGGDPASMAAHCAAHAACGRYVGGTRYLS
jgi:hypothetical protein